MNKSFLQKYKYQTVIIKADYKKSNKIRFSKIQKEPEVIAARTQMPFKKKKGRKHEGCKNPTLKEWIVST